MRSPQTGNASSGRRFSISIGGFFAAMVLLFLLIFLIQGTISLFLGVRTRLTGFEQYGEKVLRVASLLLENQVEFREEGLRALVGGGDTGHTGRDVLAAAVLDGNRVTGSIKGWLPDGMVLPSRLLTDEWIVNDLLDIYGRNLLTGARRILGRDIFAAFRLDMEELDVLGDHDLLPIISDSEGRVVWMGTTSGAVELMEHVGARGFVLRRRDDEGGWSVVASHQGSRVLMRQERLPFGLTLTLLYPMRSLLLSALSELAVGGIVLLAGIVLILLFWMAWNKGVYRSISEIACLADEMSTRLSEIDARDPLRSSESLFDMTRRFSGFRESRVREMNAFVHDLRNLFEVILHQQEELTAFNEETEAMNQELEEVNNRLVRREALWERTLDVSRTFARNEDVRSTIQSTLKTLRQDAGAFGVLISSVENDRFRLTAWDGYDGELEDFRISMEGVAASETIRSRTPVWIEDVRTHPTARPVHPSVRSELLIPLFQAGEEEGVLEVAFDKPTRRDAFLVETLTPVASFLGGLVHGEKMRREVKTSYAYLAEKLQFVTGIYHDETEVHIARIGEYCRVLAKACGRNANDQENIALFARLHDIGKVKVPHEILSKPGALTDEEFALIKRHPEWGAEIVGDASWLAVARNICLTHHEKWDGSGYPHGLRGTEIPWEGRVATIADIYDALRSSRMYKPAFSHEKTMEILLQGDGRVRPEHFDPEVLTAFESVSEEFARIFAFHRDDSY